MWYNNAACILKLSGVVNMKNLWKIVAVILVLILLINLNPTMSDFQTWLKDNLKSQTSNVFLKAGIEVGMDLGILDYVTVRDNFLVCSYYEVHLPGKTIYFFGILKKFIKYQDFK